MSPENVLKINSDLLSEFKSLYLHIQLAKKVLIFGLTPKVLPIQLYSTRNLLPYGLCFCSQTAV